MKKILNQPVLGQINWIIVAFSPDYVLHGDTDDDTDGLC